MEVVHCAAPFRLPMPSEPEAVDAEPPPSAVADLGDRGGREQELAELGVELGVAAAQPLEGHGGVLLLVVAVVGQDGGQALVRGGLGPLVVPVDRLELLGQRLHGAVVVERGFVEQLERLMESLVGQGPLLRSLLTTPGGRPGTMPTVKPLRGRSVHAGPGVRAGRRASALVGGERCRGRGGPALRRRPGGGARRPAPRPAAPQRTLNSGGRTRGYPSSASAAGAKHCCRVLADH